MDKKKQALNKQLEDAAVEVNRKKVLQAVSYLSKLWDEEGKS